MPAFRFLAYDRLHPLTGFLGELTEAFDKSIQAPFDGPGSGEFKVNRSSPQSAWAATGNYIQVIVAPTVAPVFGFFIGEGSDVMISTDEEGGEDWQRGGRGGLIYLLRSVLHEVEYQSNNFTIEGNRWVWTDRKVGRILIDILEESRAHTPNPFPDLTWDFSATVDSSGKAWETVDDEFSLPIGIDVLGAVTVLRGQGLYVRMGADLVLHAYQDYAAPQRPVLFRKGVNLREASEREIKASVAKSRVLVQGRKKTGTIIYAHTSDTGVEADIGVFEGFLKYPSAATATRLRKAGNRLISSLKRNADGTVSIGVTAWDGVNAPSPLHYAPWVDYFPGDKVTIEIPGEVIGTKAVDLITVQDSDGGEYEVTLGLNVGTFPVAGDGSDEPSTGGTGGSNEPEPPGGGGTPTPTSPAPTETINCVSIGPRGTLNRNEDGTQQLSGGWISPVAGSWINGNISWPAAGCPIGGGGWSGAYDRESWWAFTAPADSPDYLGMLVTIDASAGYTTGGFVAGMHVGIATGVAAPGRYGDHTPLAHLALGSTVQVYIPRSHIAWGGSNSIVIAPDWLCARGYFTCNTLGSFSFPINDGRGDSGAYQNIEPTGQACPIRFAADATGLSGEVAGYGAVDGVNRSFVLIGWDGTGIPEYSINGLRQSSLGVVFNRSTRTATLESPPSAGAVVLWSYTVGPLAGTITITPDPVPFVVQVPEITILPIIVLYPDPVAFVLVAPDVTRTAP